LSCHATRLLPEAERLFSISYRRIHKKLAAYPWIWAKHVAATGCARERKYLVPGVERIVGCEAAVRAKELANPLI
jgi:hypothetical protein